MSKISVKNLDLYYGDFKALKNINLEIEPNKITAFIGPSGCGKSTTGRCLVNLYEPTSGHVYFKGKDTMTLTKAEQMKFHSDVQMIFQNPYASLNPRMTVGEIVSEGMRIHTKLSHAECMEKAEALLHRVGLNKEHMSRFSHEFSGGQRQRLGIARALYHNPEILVFDEATSALDTDTETAIMEAIESFHGKKTLVIIAHRLRTIAGCDIIYKVDNGKIVETTLAAEEH